MRIEVIYRNPAEDGRAHQLVSTLESAGFPPVEAAVVDVYCIHRGPPLTESAAAGLFGDRIAQRINFGPEDSRAFTAGLHTWDLLIEISYKPGVTDPVGLTAAKTLTLEYGSGVPAGMTVRTARQYLFTCNEPIEPPLIASELYNPLIENAVILSRADWEDGRRPPVSYAAAVPPGETEVELIDVTAVDDPALAAISRDRLLALSLEEMNAVKSYYNDPNTRDGRRKRGLPPEATDVELEMIAQTWSEHCKHKIFQADIRYTEQDRPEAAETVSSLFNTYIKKATEEVGKTKSFLRSVFHDNSGVVQFHPDYCLCFKAETHNSPSALDPYGGAITGIVGVNRDILGTGKGARPIFNTNVLCFGYPDMPKEELPAGLLHPEKILHGVHRGIIDGGNQSGIPVAAGAFLFDDSYTGKPLVFCGTGGILPAEIGGEPSWIHHVDPGDLAVMVGGRIGKDGIHGATFSSQELNEESPTSAVQIGDPITQKVMADFLLEARDLGLYKGITDNGAGGLSSSLGEMAEGPGGIRIELDKCPLKYPGLAPWEILVSESQERMSLAVSSDAIDEFLDLARRRDVEAAVIGRFTDSGFIEIFFRNEPVGLLNIDFLHNGLPKMKLQAEWIPPEARRKVLGPRRAAGQQPADILLALLKEPNIASKERFVRQYDHEVQAGSVVKPFCGSMADGPTDGGVFKPDYESREGITITHGICPRYGDIDTYHMAMCAVDEAFRAHVALGGDPETVCALDNFCWPDPVESEQTPDGKYKLAQLVRACRGLYDACIAYGIPLVSGKDSMKNDARIGDKKVSVRPTLLVSLMGHVPDIVKTVTSDCKAAGDAVFLLGETRAELGGTAYERYAGTMETAVPSVKPEPAIDLYRKLHQAISAGIVHSCHDCSDGGLAVALAESAVGGRLGITADLDLVPAAAEHGFSDTGVLFSETPSRFVVTASESEAERMAEIFSGSIWARIGTVTDDGVLRFVRGGRELAGISMDDMVRAWNRGQQDE